MMVAVAGLDLYSILHGNEYSFHRHTQHTHTCNVHGVGPSDYDSFVVRERIK